VQYLEWYRYLNCGYRLGAVGGTDKMSAGQPMGGVRTYAQLAPDQPMSFDNWAAAGRAGPTYSTSGPLLSLSVEGHSLGEEIKLPKRGGTVEIQATAQCLWPMHVLEIVLNGQVIASTARPEGARELTLTHQAKITQSSWIAARCGSTWCSHRPHPSPLGAHSSPVYVLCGAQEIFSPADATYMLTLLDGGMTYLDTLSVKYDEARHQRMRAIMLQARHALEHRLGLTHLH
jgi:hypothetical protein